MFGNFFKDRVVDWDSVKELALILGSVVGGLGYITLTAWCMICWRFKVGIALFMTPIVGFILFNFFVICFPKNPVEAQARRARNLEKAARKAEARMHDRAMKRRNLTNFARWDSDA